MAEKKSFVLYIDMCSHIKILTDEDAGKLFKAIVEYQESGTSASLPPGAEMLYRVICDQMDRDAEKWETIRQKRVQAINARYNKPKENTSEYTSIHMNTNEAVNVNDNVNANVNGNGNVNGNVINTGDEQPAETPQTTTAPDNLVKKTYGQYGHIQLTDAELDRLKQFRPDDWEAKMQRVDDYIEQTGKKYGNQLYTILKWAEEDDAKEAARRKKETSVHFENESRNKGKYEGIFTDLFSEEMDNYINGGEMPK